MAEDAKTDLARPKGVCIACQSPVFADAPHGLCSVCLFKTALGLDNGHEAKPSAEHTPAEFDDYELLEEIGRGGQGVVYRARQKSLNRIVALKIIGLGRWATEAHLKRFRFEAEAAAGLSHPAIVPIYDIGESEDCCYFSMNLIEGEALDKGLNERALSNRQIATLIVKLARAVHYAHEHGILHRDIKPGNILLDTDGEPHLTDFGLARLAEKESDMTRTADVLGTPGYIAPEQSGGSRFEIAKATDVYGLGAVLYHLLTGRPPFAGQTIYETVKQVLETEPRSPQSLNPKVDRDLSTICLKCLEKDPEHRYPSALSLAEDLARWLGNEPIHARPVGLFTRGVKFLQRHGAATITIALIVSLLGTIGVIISRGELFHRLPPNSIAVLPFENLGDKENAFFADGIQDEILTHLASIADLKVISRSSVMSYRGNSSHNLRHVGQELGVAHLLEGSVQRSGNRVRVNAQLIDARNDVHLWAQTYDRDLPDVFTIQTEIAKRIAESLQANLSKREEQALAVKPTENTEAYDAYLRGRALEAHGPLLGSSAEIAGLYERAVQLDPKFATAWARLSRAEANMYFNTEIDTSQRDRAKRALEKAQQLEPNAPETLLALGYYQYWVLRDYSSAENTFDQVGQTAPGSSEVPVALALLARYQGNLNQSITHFEQALTLDPRNVELLVSAAWTYGRFRQFSAALKLYNRALDVTPNDLDVMAAKAAIYQAQGNLQGAAKLLSNVNEQVPDEDTFAIKITQLRLERNYREAMRLLQARLVQSRFDFDYEAINVRIALALMHRFGGDTASAKTTAEGARNTLESLCKDQPDNSYLAMELSQAYAAVGDKDSALREAGRTDMLQPSVKDPTQAPTNREILASIQASFGEVSPAISNLAQLLNTPYLSMLYRPGVITPALLRLDPIWDSLRTDPGFQKLCEQKQP